MVIFDGTPGPLFDEIGMPSSGGLPDHLESRWEPLRLRRKAAGALGEIKDVKSVAALGRARDDQDLETRRAVVRALAEIESDATVPFLIRAIRDCDPGIRKAAAEALRDRKVN